MSNKNIENIDEIKEFENNIILKYILSYKWRVFFLFISIIIIIVFFGLSIVLDVSLLGWCFVPITIIFLIYSDIKREIKSSFIRKFAELQGFDYEKEASLESVDGRLFEIGDSVAITDVIKGKFKNYPIRLFNYFHVVDYGRSSHVCNSTVFEIRFKGFNFPHILLEAKNIRSYGRVMKKNDIEINLEEEFNNIFNLYTQRGYGIEALQIFNHDILCFLQDVASDYSIEFSKDKIYIYDDLIISNKKEIKEIFEVVEKILYVVQPFLKRLRNDFEVLHPYFNKGKKGKKEKSKKILISTVKIIIAIFSFILFRFFGEEYSLAYILGLLGILVILVYPIFERKGKL